MILYFNGIADFIPYHVQDNNINKCSINENNKKQYICTFQFCFCDLSNAISKPFNIKYFLFYEEKILLFHSFS